VAVSAEYIGEMMAQYDISLQADDIIHGLVQSMLSQCFRPILFCSIRGKYRHIAAEREQDDLHKIKLIENTVHGISKSTSTRHCRQSVIFFSS